ncbi:MAG: SpvB/TcaC N-terminal domain-containing protein [Pseudomonadota bacterium]
MASPEKTAAPPDGEQKPAVPSIALPKGGGAIRGMGEKFAANPVTGTGAMTVPIATSPGRSGFGPQLSLSYDSGAGNGPFGFGWSLPLPAITRKTDKGLPQYRDAEESDGYILSGAEDLVPEFKKMADGNWEFKDGNHVIREEPRIVGDTPYTVRYYRPRIEGLFARIERWTKNATGEIHWRSISKDNIATLYGKDNNSRIFDPAEIPGSGNIDNAKPTRIFSWLICETRDDKGNAILYKYKQENGDGVVASKAHERNRGDGDDPRRTPNRYLKYIRYGNQAPLLDENELRPCFLSDNQIEGTDWMFEVVLDYGEHDAETPLPNDAGKWNFRIDPFSTYRAGFEVRTTRLCKRVLMFHHFDSEAGVEKDCLVRSTDFTYCDPQDPNDVSTPVYTFLRAVTQTGYHRNNGGYLKRSLPPIEFEYTQPIVQKAVADVDPASLENLPIGVDGAIYQWADLHGEGIPGILTEQADAWFYKRNLSPASERPVEFGPLERVAGKPNIALAGGAQFMDLAGDGLPDVVVMEGPAPGLYEHDEAEGWQSFRPFTSRLNRNMRDPDLKFVDLDGDGHADVLITEDDAFVWHASLAEEGFGPARRVAQALDEEKGPRLVFADGTQSVYLADLSGDGFTDLVRIRNGEVCYWPNLGYCRFGPKVTMDNAPRFDTPDQFDQKRIRLADIDGSGTTDIFYLHREGVRLYFNQSGNSWSQALPLNAFPRIDNLVSIAPTDLLGNGTACLVWSSPLPADAARPMKYVNLMGDQKPHLLVKTINNLGAETVVQYAPSTKFYLQDKLDGNPWVTRLPFPVHCVEKVTISDKWRGTSFSSTYSYHHGYFDGIEREFRGFGRVEQVDCESYGTFEKGNSESPYITGDKALFQPPVKTVTWYHTGASLDRAKILSHFEHEYFPHGFEALRPDEVNVLGAFQENILPEPDLAEPCKEEEALSPEEWREAMRACKGMMLRQEVYELDVDALERDQHLPVKLFTTAYHNCHLRRLQPKAFNPHAVFLAAESEAITYHYELDLTQDKVQPDPRIAHTLNLKVDEYANVLQSVAVVYPRLGNHIDDTLPSGAEKLIAEVQKERHLAYTENRFTDDVDDNENHRLRVPCEVLTYELTGIGPEDADNQGNPDTRDNFYFTLDELRRYRLSLVHQPDPNPNPNPAPDNELMPVLEIPYHQLPNRTEPEKRIVEHLRMLFFKDNPADNEALKAPLDFGQLGRLGLPYETYKLALTEDLLKAVFNDKFTSEIGTHLSKSFVSGYRNGADLIAHFAPPIPAEELAGQYWIPSGITCFEPEAAKHFYLPTRYTDPFGNVTSLKYDRRDLFVASSTDATGNTTSVMKFDFRVLAPAAMQDMNDNLSEVFFDVLGLPVAMALKGKGNEGDNLAGYTAALANPQPADIASFFTTPNLNEALDRTWLGNATARHVYYFGDVIENGKTTWAAHPACACGLLREQHVASGGQSPLQAAFEYSDGMGTVIVKKIQAEPETKGNPLRWVAGGKTILNNKGKPVKQFEPYFSLPTVGHCFEDPKEEGVTPVIYYDAAGRTVRTEMPDGSYSRVEFSPWHVRTFDQNDTVKEPENIWFKRKTAADASAEDNRAAQLAAEHASTPALTILDSLGREVISIAHNRVRNTAGELQDEKYLTFTRLDAEGKPLWIRDARQNLVMQYIQPPEPNTQAHIPNTGYVPCYDIAGNLLFQHSMDAGDRWTLNDAAGKPMFSWDSRGHIFRTEYDKLHRPTGSFVKGADLEDTTRLIQFEKLVYGDSPGSGLTDANAKALNLRGKLYKHCDSAGIIINLGRNPDTETEEAFDFKGNLLRSTRQLIGKFKEIPDWSRDPELEKEIFSSATTYDALNRPVMQTTPNTPAMKPSVIRIGYNEANLLERVDANLRNEKDPNGDLKWTLFVTNIDYDAKGQRTLIEYGCGALPGRKEVRTLYSYDPETFRLSHLRTTRGIQTAVDCIPRREPRQCQDPPADCLGLQNQRCVLQDLSYAYDPVGNITHIQDDAQQTIFFRNKRVEPSNDYTYDALYRLIKATGREHLGQTGGQPNSPTPPDAFNSFHTRLNHPGDGNAMGRYTEQYVYDAVGNILSMKHTGMDPANSGWQRCYQYALDSNRLLSTGNPTDPHNPNDQCPTQYSAAPVYAEKYEYDAHGNMITMPHLSLMEWDFKDQLNATSRQVVNGTPPPDKVPETTYYVYDAGGQRVRKVTERDTGTRKEERVYLGGFEIYRTYNGNGNDIKLERETLHIMDENQRIALVETKTIDCEAQVPNPLIRYQFGNHLGSASLELDYQAQIISYEEYAPYGNTTYGAVRNQTETPKRYRYTGKERDNETGLYYHVERYYAAWIGRWIGVDNDLFVDGSNPFTYVKLSPTNFTDPTGRAAKHARLGKSFEAASEKHGELANELRQMKGLEPIEVDYQKGVTPERKIIPDEVKKTPKAEKPKLVVELKARHVNSPSNKNPAYVRQDIENSLEQVKNQLQELEANGKVAPNPKGKVLIALHDSNKGASSTKALPGIRDIANEVKKEWVDSATNLTEKAARERVSPVVTTRDRYQKATNYMKDKIAKSKALVSAAANSPTVEKIVKSKALKVVVAVAPILASGVAKAAPVFSTTAGSHGVATEISQGNIRRGVLEGIGMSEIPIVSQTADIGLAIEDAGWVAKEILDPEQKMEQWFYNTFLK